MALKLWFDVEKKNDTTTILLVWQQSGCGLM